MLLISLSIALVARRGSRIDIGHRLVANRGAVASGISAADERAVERIDNDAVDMACPFVPVAPASKEFG
jgi:hypothetical protein